MGEESMGWIAGLPGFVAAGGIARLIVAFAGAVLLIVILRKRGMSARNSLLRCARRQPNAVCRPQSI